MSGRGVGLFFFKDALMLVGHALSELITFSESAARRSDSERVSCRDAIDLPSTSGK